MQAGLAIDAVAIVHALPGPALLVVDGRLAAVNAAATVVLGINADAVGTPVRELRLLRRVPMLATALVSAARGATPPPLTARALATPGGLRRVRLTARPVLFGTEPAAVLLLVEDEGADRGPTGLLSDAESRFIATLAHELRNPLGAIVHALHIIGQRVHGDPLVRRARVIAERQVRHQARLLEDLFDLSRLRAGKLELQLARVDLVSVVRDTLETGRLDAEARAQRLGATLAADALYVRGDRTRLEQVVRNLLDNARKYTPVGGEIAVWVGIDVGTAVIRIRDSGVGIDPEALTHIFEPYVQGNTSPAGSRGGLGLGLSLIRSLVEQHGGTVSAKSAGPGRGSEFEVRFPMDSAAPSPDRDAAEPPDTAAPVQRRSVLVIEDDRDTRDLLRLVLEMDGHHVEAAANGYDGVRMASATAPDVVLIDLGLPEVDGYEVARRLRRRLGAAVRLVALTGYGGPEAAARVREAGFDAHVVKPAAPDEIAAALAG